MYSYQDHYVPERDNITLTCTVDGFPKPQINWFRDTVQLKEEKKATLVKRYITEEGEGTYTCEAKNQGGSANDSFDIIVDGKKERNPSPF